MAIGLLTADVGQTSEISGQIIARRTEFQLVGCQSFAFLRSSFYGDHAHLDASSAADSPVRAREEIAWLKELEIDQIANVGTFGTILDASLICRVRADGADCGTDPDSAAGDRHDGSELLGPGGDRQKLLVFADRLQRNRIKLLWLADLFPDLRAEEGLMNKTPLKLDQAAIDAAVERARTNGRSNRSARALVFEGATEIHNHFGCNVDPHLDYLEGLAQAGPRLLVNVIGANAHCPLDPPLIGPNTIAKARRAGICTIVLEAGRGLIWRRQGTLDYADQHGISIFGAKPFSWDKARARARKRPPAI